MPNPSAFRAADSARLEIRAPDWERESGTIIDLCAKVFARPYFEWDNIAESYLTTPPYDAAASRIGLIDGRVVTHWGVWDNRMRVGRGNWRVAGIGCVACHPHYRKQGLLSQTARASMATYREAGYDATLLFGIDQFYHRFGYVSAFPMTRFTIDPHRLPEPSPSLPERIGESRRSEVDRLYNQWHRQSTGTLIRPFLNRRFPGSRDAAERQKGRDAFYGWPVATGGGGRGGRGGNSRRRERGDGLALAGYVAAGWSGGEMRLSILETAGEAADALAAVSALAREWQPREVVFDSIPPRGPLALLLRAGVACETIEHHATGRAMIASVSLPGMLRGLLPELTARRRRAAPWAADWRGRVSLEGDGESAVLRLDGHGVHLEANEGAARGKERIPHRVAGGQHLPQLLLGQQSPGELAARKDIRMTGDAAWLAETLFPATHPAMSKLDYY